MRICDIDFDLDMLRERSQLPFADPETILPPWWEIACGNARLGIADRSIERYVRRLFYHYDVVWGLYPDPDRPGRFDALLLDGAGVFTGAILYPVEGPGFQVTAWHCRDLAEAKAICLAFSKDAEESLLLSSGVQHGIMRDYEETGDYGGEPKLR